MMRNTSQSALEGTLDHAPIDRLAAPLEVASCIWELCRNEALAGEVYPIHGSLRLGSRG
jgi:3-oxoacyl-[acyl-carrier protein] reductase